MGNAGAAVLISACFLETDLTEIQCDVSDVSQQYQGLGAALRERQQQLSAMLEKMQEVQEEASSMLKWLESKERTLSELDASSSPTKTETMRAQAEHNKVTALPERKTGIRASPPKGPRRCALLQQAGRVSGKDLPWVKEGLSQKGPQEGSWSRSPCTVLDLLGFRPVAFRHLAREKGAYL